MKSRRLKWTGGALALAAGTTLARGGTTTLTYVSGKDCTKKGG